MLELEDEIREKLEKFKKETKRKRLLYFCNVYAILSALLGVFFSYAGAFDRDIFSSFFSLFLLILSYRLFSCVAKEKKKEAKK